jgi:hypothetical protein
MMHQEVVWQPPEVKVSGMRQRRGDFEIEYWGIATLQPNGKYHCLANVAGALCRVEVEITFEAKRDDT